MALGVPSDLFLYHVPYPIPYKMLPLPPIPGYATWQDANLPAPEGHAEATAHNDTAWPVA